MQDRLLAWFAEHGRSLPWRGTRDPYAILVSEVMLQQTQVSRVVPRWTEWLERWPTVETLAAASPADVIRAWQGLGYNRRGLNLHRAARVVAEHGWPDDLTELPGVGPYTAAALGNFAFGRPVLPVDVNIGRVLERSGGEFGPEAAQALFDLGATVCLARVPALRRVPTRRCVPFTRTALRAGAEAGAVRGLVPPAAGAAAAARRGGAPAGRARPGSARLARRRRPGGRGGLPRYASLVTTRYDELIAALRDAAPPDRAAPADFAPYLDKVRNNAYRITDADVEALKAAGHSEDEIFEQTVSAAVGAGLSRLRAGLEAMG